MNKEDFARAMSLFETARKLPPGDQRVFLDGEAKDLTEIRRTVERMLAHDGTNDDGQDPLIGAGAVLIDGLNRDARAVDTDVDLPGKEWIGRTIGPYRIVGVRGAGGMAVVFEAEQRQPARRVALKVLSTMLCTPDMLRRFEFEAEILARLQHPHIAQIFDAGTLDGDLNGRPFFVMELIDGAPLTAYARQHDLTAPDRLRLMADVCRAVEYAHQKGVVHRDLKPANILVDRAGHPKVLDFGIARATDIDVWHTTMHTATGQLVGTLAYMSPEQLSGDPRSVDTRADVYALGVILFELLGSRQPFDVAQRPLTEAIRLISEQPPPLLGTLNRVCRGDVETIVQKALEKDPGRRYDSPAALSGDIERFLCHEPIHARPVSAVYQLRKLVVRHKMPFVFAALLFVAVTALAVVSTVQANRIARERDRAVLAEAATHQRSDQVRRLAHTFIFDVHDRIKNLPGSTKARAYIAETAMEYLDRLRQDAGDDSAVLADIAAGYVKVGQAQGAMSFANMGKTVLAQENLHKAIEILEPLCARDPANRLACGGLATAYETLGEVFLQQGKPDQSAEAYEKSLAVAQALHTRWPEDRSVRRSVMVQANNIGESLAQRGRIQEAFDVFQRGAASAAQLAHEEPGDVQAQQDLIYSCTRMSKMAARLGHQAEAAAHAQRAFDLIEPLAQRHPMDTEVQRMLAVACVDQGDHLRADEQDPRAIEQYQRAQAIYEALVDADPDNARARMDLATSAGRLGDMLHGEGDLDGAVAQFERSCLLREENVRSAPDSALYRRELAVAYEKMGNVLVDQAEFDRALSRYGQSLDIRRALAEADPSGQQSQRDLAVAHYKLGSAHAGAAQQSTIPTTARVHRWRSARGCFQSSLDHLRWMAERQLTSPADAHVPAFLQEQIERADAGIIAVKSADGDSAAASP